MEYLIGIDEVGRGALAGPVVVGAVAVPIDGTCPELEIIFPRGLRDSKQATVIQRIAVNKLVRERYPFGIGEVAATSLDEQGLSQALKEAAGQAIAVAAAHIQGGIIVHADAGLFHPFEDRYPTVRSVKADETILPVLLASHLAKVYRDKLMQQLALEHTGYGWEKNVGYGTVVHREAIRRQGITPYHRQSFLKGL